jgi:hypothetical protein
MTVPRLTVRQAGVERYTEQNLHDLYNAGHRPAHNISYNQIKGGKKHHGRDTGDAEKRDYHTHPVADGC